MPLGPYPRSVQLDYQSTTAQVTSIGASVVDTGLSVTFTVGARPVMVHGYAPWSGHTTATKGVSLYLTDNSNTLVDARATTGINAAANSDYGDLNIWWEFTTPGSYTIKLRTNATATGGFLNTSQLGVMFLEAIER